MENEKFKRAVEIQDEINKLERNIKIAEKLSNTDSICEWHAGNFFLSLEDRYSQIKTKELLDSYSEDLSKAINKLKEQFKNL